MTYHPERHHRHSIRLQSYDYAQAGAYFVTIVTYRRECLFGQVNAEGGMVLSPLGQIVHDEWLRSAAIRQEIELDTFVVMPNHVHGIAFIVGAIDRGTKLDVGATGRSPLLPYGPAAKSLGAFIAGFKSSVTSRINTVRYTLRIPVWQRNYYEHIIRDENDLYDIQRYIEENPLRWSLDPENPFMDKKQSKDGRSGRPEEGRPWQVERCRTGRPYAK